MDWSARLDTSGVVGPAGEGQAALLAMREELAAVGEALKKYDAAATSGAAARRALLPTPKTPGAAGGAAEEAAKKAGGGAKKTADLFARQASDGKLVTARSKEELAARVKDRELLVKEEAAKAKARDKVTADAEKANAKKKAADERAKAGAKAAGFTPGAGAGAAGSVLRGAVGLAAGAAGAAGLYDLAKIAIGQRALAQLAFITARTQLGFRQLFRGVDASPLTRAFDRFSRNFTAQTVTGRALGDVLTRAFNGAFKAIEAAEPYVTAFTQGVVLGALYIENAWLRARIALFPFTSALGDATTKTNLFRFAAIAGGGALVAAGVYAAVAAAPFLALAAAISAVAAAFDQASKLAKEWDQNSAAQIARKFADDIGISKRTDADIGIVQGADYDKAQAAKAAAAGQATGKALGDGVAAGMAASEGKVKAAGAALAAAADQGVRDKAEIRSPSRLMHRRALQMGEGAEGGLEDAAPRVQRAAAQALVPAAPRLAASVLGGGARGAIVGPLVSLTTGPITGTTIEIAGEVRRVLDLECQMAAERLAAALLSRSANG